MTTGLNAKSELSASVPAAEAPVRPRVRQRRRRRRLGVPPVQGLLPLVIGLVIWQLTVSKDSAYFPPPSQWWHAVRESWTSGALAPAIRETAKGFAIALVILTVVGAALGALIGRVRIVDHLLGTLLEFLRVMPPAAIVPLAVLFGGYDLKTKIVVIVLSAIWPVLLQVRASSRSIPLCLLDTARALHLSRWETLRKVILPSLIPGLFVGVRVAAPIALVSTLLVELLTAIPGLGALIETAQSQFMASMVFGLVATAGVLGVIVTAAVYVLEALLGRYLNAEDL